MRIYYFGELIQSESPKTSASSDTLGGLDKDTNETKSKVEAQTRFVLTEPECPKKTGMDSAGDILKEIDLSLDACLPFRFQI